MFEPDLDDYWTDDTVTVMGRCENCGDFKLVVYTTDPFDVEIRDDHTEYWLCSKCHYESGENI